MQRINSVEPSAAEGRQAELLDQVQSAFGSVPNAAKVLANSPAVLEAFLQFSSAMKGAEIGPKLHTQVKLATTEANACEYCASLLTAVAPSAGLSANDILEGRRAAAEESRTNAALEFASAVMETGGKVDDAQIAAMRDEGFDDGAIVEVVASVVLGCFTNFVNNAAQTKLEFPKAKPVAKDSAASC